MDPITLIALASAAGFVFRRMSGSETKKKTGLSKILPRRSRITPGRLQKTGAGIDIDEIEELPEYSFVKKLVDARFPIVFVTGGAGTGKTTFVNWLMHHYSGGVLLAAPTAIAATNIDGKTIHSLFQLPLQWITRSAIKSANYRHDIRNAKLLIIDEISMVNANLLDGVSAFLRKNRGVDKPFGGLPLIMVGDLFQLPPVVKPGLMEFFDRFYDGETRFYASRALVETSITYYAVELTRTFRQFDRVFVDILSDIREGRNLENAVRTINSSCEITNRPPDGAVWLAPRRSEVENANQSSLQALRGRLFRFEGRIEGDFRQSVDTLPSPMMLDIKVGAQVMFTQNDALKRWVNGTVGVVESVSEEIVVRTQPYGKRVRVDRASWVNFKYSWNSKTRQIEKEVVGSFTQFPLILAWAVTIHKSQGKTIEKVHLDLRRGVFAFGQTYVALSRCRELKGLTLSRPLQIEDIKVDRASQLFNDHLHDLMEKLPREKMLQVLEEQQTGTGKP
ncbi:MAG: DEAD/DEAH box helicase [Desulfopila sp.]|jgi:ATP-dependent exoDNAse (exonuclease V) alpha subunit|nr:DEAD/DEAH box helicase [Desulfopila sp.]